MLHPVALQGRRDFHRNFREHRFWALALEVDGNVAHFLAFGSSSDWKAPKVGLVVVAV